MVQKARIRLSGTSPVTLDGICSQVKDIAVKTGVNISVLFPCPPKNWWFRAGKARMARGAQHGTTGR